MKPTCALHVSFGQLDAAKALVMKYHYSHRWPSVIEACGTLHQPGGLFGNLGEAVAACVFGIPPTRWSEAVLELERLVRRDDVSVPLTGLISATCEDVRRRGTFDLLVSYADWTQGHHGGIYQAASWNYDGQRERAQDGLVVNGKFVPGRMCFNLWGTRSPNQLRHEHRRWDIQPHYDEGKHLYWRALSRHGMKKATRLGLRCSPYPKPAVQVSMVTRGASSAESRVQPPGTAPYQESPP